MTSATRGLRAAVMAATMLLHALSAGAADKELLDMLLENGALTEAQYEQLLANDSSSLRRGEICRSIQYNKRNYLGPPLERQPELHRPDVRIGNRGFQQRWKG